MLRPRKLIAPAQVHGLARLLHSTNRRAAPAARAPAEQPGAWLLPSRHASPGVSRVLELAWGERGRLGAGIALSFVASGLSLAFPAAIGWMVDLTLAASDGTASAVPAVSVAPNAVSGVPSVASAAAAALGPHAATAALLVIFAAQAVVLTVRARLLTAAGESISASMRTRAFASLLRQDVAFFDRNESGELLNRLSADCAQLQKVIATTAGQALRSLTMAAGSTAMLVATSPSLAVLILAVFPAVFAFGSWQGRAMRREQKEVQRLLAHAGKLAARSLTSLRTLRALGVERSQLDQYARAVDGARERAVAVGVRSAVFDAGVYFAANVSMLAVVARGASLVSAGELSAGELSSVVLYAMWLGFASSQIAQAYAEAMRAAGASERLLQLMSRQPAMNDSGGVRLALPPAGALGLSAAAAAANADANAARAGEGTGGDCAADGQPMGAPPAGRQAAPARGLAIEFRDVHFSYASRVHAEDAEGGAGSRQRAEGGAEGAEGAEGDSQGWQPRPRLPDQPETAGRALAGAGSAAGGEGAGASLRGLSLSIRAGERVGLVGESGCGKSTLLRLLSRLYDVDDGAVLVGGVDVRLLDPTQLRGPLVGVVPQEPALLAGTIRENIALGARHGTSGGGGSGQAASAARDGGSAGGAGDYLRDDGRYRPDGDGAAAAEGARSWRSGAAERQPPQGPAATVSTAEQLSAEEAAARLRQAVEAAVDAAGLRELVRSLPDGLDTQVGEGGVTLSGGEKQRVAIARLLMAEPAVVLLDEFSSALDQATEQGVTARLSCLLAGRTVVTVAHRMSALRGLRIERVIELGKGGSIVSDVSMAEWEARTAQGSLVGAAGVAASGG